MDSLRLWSRLQPERLVLPGFSSKEIWGKAAREAKQAGPQPKSQPGTGLRKPHRTFPGLQGPGNRGATEAAAQWGW